MNWLKVGAIVVGGIVVYFVIHSVVSLVLSLLGAIVFVAIVAGGGYVAYKLLGARRRRQVRSRRREREVRPEPETRTVAVPPATATSRPAHHDVEDELARMKREMGR
jgi:hypothetical protein